MTMLKEALQQEWVSYAEAERYSGLSHTTLWRYVTTGQLRAARVGACAFIFRACVSLWSALLRVND
jgi:hypothetical protein